MPIPGASGSCHPLLNTWTGNGVDPHREVWDVILKKEHVLETENNKSSLNFLHSSRLQGTLQ